MRIPSIKTLSVVFGERAKEARELLEKKRKTTDYQSVVEWERQCFRRPTYIERLMCALNEIAGTHGVEFIEHGENARSPSILYLNTGDPYTPTFMVLAGCRYTIGDWGSIVERGNYR